MIYQLKGMETKIIQEKVMKNIKEENKDTENTTLESLIKGKHKDISN